MYAFIPRHRCSIISSISMLVYEETLDDIHCKKKKSIVELNNL